MSRIAVSPEELAAAGAQLRSAAQPVTTSATSLRAATVHVTGFAATDATNASSGRWTTCLASFAADLQAAAAKIAGAKDVYEAQEAHLSAGIGAARPR